jgi:DNA-binding transcriptional regulator YhcF (GntR family)
MTQPSPEDPWRSLQVDPESRIPIWVQLRTQLGYLIATGGVPIGTQLPPVRRLAARLGVAVDTVRQSYEDLIRASLARSLRGRGTFTSLPASSVDGDGGDNRVWAEADAALAGFLGAGSPGDVRRMQALIHRLRMLDGGIRVGFVGVEASAARYAEKIGDALPVAVVVRPMSLDELRGGRTPSLSDFTHLITLMFHVAEVERAAPQGTRVLPVFSQLQPDVLDRIHDLPPGRVALVARADTLPIYRDLVSGRRPDLEILAVDDDAVHRAADLAELVAVLHTTVTAKAVRDLQIALPLVELAHSPQDKSLHAVAEVVRRDAESLLELQHHATLRAPESLEAGHTEPRS